MLPYQHLNSCDRKVIKKMLGNGKSIREIARYSGYSPSTISREIKRNKGQFWYHPIHAHEKYILRRKNSGTRKINKIKKLKKHIVKELKDGKSPDIISGRLRLTHKHCPEMQVTHESIYCWIYSQTKEGHNWYKYLARGERKRQRRLNKKRSRIKIPDRRSIHERPQSIETRRWKGHWEGDTIIGKRQQGCIATLVERKSFLLAAGLMRDKKASTCNRAILEAFGDISNKSIKSITFDNGSEFYKHKDLQKSLECPIHFVDPDSSWQRGINEHTNGMLRKYFPKNMSFKILTQNDVDMAVRKLNNRPRKSLGYLTPYEVFYNLPVALET